MFSFVVFTLHPAYSRVGKRNLVLSYPVGHFSPSKLIYYYDSVLQRETDSLLIRFTHKECRFIISCKAIID